MHAGRRGNLHKRNAESVQREDLVFHPLGRFFLKADCFYLPAVRERPVEGDKCSALEPARVGAVDDQLPHRVHLRDRCHGKHLSDGEADRERFVIHRCRGLLIVLHKAGRVVGIVPEHPVMLHLLLCSPVNLSHLADRCAEVAAELAVMLRDLAQNGRAVAEKFLPCVQLLVDLDTGHEAERLIIHVRSCSYTRL